ncbi:MAG: 3-phosphoshikimate 1-carboxyvinyltransferase, partial [Candidatus Altiarchaeales archaeon]|nr:3-phosphoshikimate 1-carboxyvinyltransferase [Candidatus Altiarchaeales archaeon]
EELDARVDVPGSKSYTNRALTVGSLSDGETILRNSLVSDDTEFMVNALEKMGVELTCDGNEIRVNGTSGDIRAPKEEIYVGNAGTAIRFLTGLASLARGKTRITGDARMQKRPIEDLLEGLRNLGVNCYSVSGSGCPPVIIEGGSLRGGTVELNASKSSQYLSSILMVAPYAEEDVEIKARGLTSKPYVDITTDVMNAFKVVVENEGSTFRVRAGQRYKCRRYRIEGDYSSASYFFAAAAITPGKIRVGNLNPKSVQGDRRFLDILKEMGCEIEVGDSWVEVRGNELRGVDVDMNEMPDLVPTLSIIALFAEGETEIRDVGNLRIKETDRLKALATELRKVGAEVRQSADSISIKPRKIRGAVIDTYNDHRMAMCFSILGLRVPGVRIRNPGCVDKSFPGFFDKLDQIREGR